MMPANGVSIEALIKAQALGAGFDLVGITSLGPVETAAKFEEWLNRGFAGEMSYLERGRDKRRDSRRPFPGARSAIVVALNYGGTQKTGAVARYARGNDYHGIMEKKLRSILRWLREVSPTPVSGKPYVDTGPILERDIARRAGLGWFGKNTNLINPRIGSFFFIGTLLVDLELQPDDPFPVDRCGTCTRCMDACPTAAIVEAGVLDATRCISYLTIENRGSIPLELRESVGELVYGCDICQDVCPWNQSFAADLREQALTPAADLLDPDPAWLLQLDDVEFRQRFLHSPVKRARRAGLARNAAVALGNRGNAADKSALERAARCDPDPLVREHSEWALSQLSQPPEGITPQ